MNALTPTVPQNSDPFQVQTLADAMKLAEMMSKAKLVPQHLQGSPADCLLIVEQARNWRMSPFAVAQAASSVKGRLMFEGKLVAAAVETSGVLEGYFDYEFSGSGKDRTVTVSATRRGESKPRSVEVRLGDVETENVWWKKTADQMLCYAGARVWARRWTPSVMLGVYSPEEFDPEPRREAPAHSGPTIDGQAEPTAQTSAPRQASQRPRDAVDADTIPALDDEPAPAKPTPEQAARKFADEAIGTLDGLNTIEAFKAVTVNKRFIDRVGNLTRYPAEAGRVQEAIDRAKRRLEPAEEQEIPLTDAGLPDDPHYPGEEA